MNCSHLGTPTRRRPSLISCRIVPIDSNGERGQVTRAAEIVTETMDGDGYSDGICGKRPKTRADAYAMWSELGARRAQPRQRALPAENLEGLEER